MMIRLCLVLVLLAPSPISIKVSPSGFAPAHTSIRIDISIPHNAVNRQLDVIFENGDTYYQHSTIQLDGERARAIVTFLYPNLPEGTYVAEAVLLQLMEGKWTEVRVRSHKVTVI